MRLILSAFALGTGALAIAIPVQAQAPAAKDWSTAVVLTPEGGFRMGNPDAKVKLVEYGSLTCPHCADFAAASREPLARLVRAGKVSFEFRNYVLNGIDATATLLARCAVPGRFFPLVDRLYETQPEWVGKIRGLPDAEKEKLKLLSDGERLARLADIGGLTTMAGAAGIEAARGKQCLADPAGLERIGQIGEAAAAMGVEGTPTFFINGVMVPVSTWEELEPLIRQAGG
jgi:protein-disulfide isomerase